MKCKWILLTDAPPMRSGGVGCSVLSWRWIEAVKDSVAIVVTHRMDKSHDIKKIKKDSPVPLFLYMDFALVGLRRICPFLRSFADIILFVFSLPSLCGKIRSHGANRIFAFFGGDGYFLLNAWLLHKVTRLPLEIYLVDDLEESSRQAGRNWQAGIIARLERMILPCAVKVWVISKGYADHLKNKYSIESQWLPIPMGEYSLEYHPYKPAFPDVRSIVYVGAVNQLYIPSIKEMLDAIVEFNRSARYYRLRLVVVSYHDVHKILSEYDEDTVCFYMNLYGKELEEILQTSWATFLPYSFDDGIKLMVSTSFASKLLEYFRAGRPILVYGPEYASVMRYFHENRIPLVATERGSVRHLLNTVEEYDSIQTIAKYRELIESNHSHHAIASILHGAERVRTRV